MVAASACALLLVNLYEALGRVRSVEVRSSIADQLTQNNSFGLTVTDVVDLLRVVVFVSAALAAAGLVLSVYTLQRHQASRVGLTVVAVLMLFTATFVTGLLPVLVAFAVSRLWSRDARDWFAGREPRTASGPPPADTSPTPPTTTASEVWPPPRTPAAGFDPPTGAPQPGPPPSPYSYGTRPPGPSPKQQQQPQQPPWAGPAPVARARTGDERPTQVTVAVWLTWVACSLAALVCLLLAVTLAADAGRLVSELQKNPRISDAGLTEQDIIRTLWVVAAVGVAWSLAAIALAVLAYHRVDAGRIGLVVSAVGAAVVGLVAAPFGWLNAAAAVATVVLLLRRDAHRWFRRRGPDDETPSPAAGPPPGPPPGVKPPVW